MELAASITEAEALRSLETDRQNEGREISELLSVIKKQESDHPLNKELTKLKNELQHWRKQSHALQLARLRLTKELQQAQLNNSSEAFEASLKS